MSDSCTRNAARGRSHRRRRVAVRNASSGPIDLPGKWTYTPDHQSCILAIRTWRLCAASRATVHLNAVPRCGPCTRAVSSRPTRRSPKLCSARSRMAHFLSERAFPRHYSSPTISTSAEPLSSLTTQSSRPREPSRRAAHLALMYRRRGRHPELVPCSGPSPIRVDTDRLHWTVIVDAWCSPIAAISSSHAPGSIRGGVSCSGRSVMLG
jgi:hypothetical protein